VPEYRELPVYSNYACHQFDERSYEILQSRLVENINAIAGALADCICQLAFGGGFASRTLFANDEGTVIYTQRPVVLVGINDFVVRGDQRDSSVFLHLSAFPDTSRRAESKFWPGFALTVRESWAACASCRRSI
jgi:hypothetical protein